MDRRLGFLFVALAAVIHGSLGVTTKGLLNVATTNAYSITLLRAIGAFLACLLISVLVLGKRTFWIARRDVRTMVFAGLLMAGYQVTFIIALNLVNVTIGALVTLCTVPIFAAVLARVLLGEALRPSGVLALACAIVGVGLLVGFDDLQSGPRPWMGVAFALVAALGYALFQVCGRVLANRYHPMQTLSVFFLVVVLALLPITQANGFVTAYPPVGWLLLAHLGLGISVLGYALLVLGLRATPVTVATIVSFFEPLTSTLLAWLLLGERLGAPGLLGAALLLGAMTIVFRASGAATAEVTAV